MSAAVRHPISAPGVRVHGFAQGFLYTGRRKAMLACGLVAPGQLPGEPGQPKSVVRFKDPEGRTIIIRHSGKQSLHVRVTYPEDTRTHEEICQEARRRIEDPERVRREALAQASVGAQLKVGELAVIWDPGGEGHGVRVEILAGFDFYRIEDPDGPHVDPQGARCRFAWGYRARMLGGRAMFFCAHELRGLDLRIAHLRRVA